MMYVFANKRELQCSRISFRGGYKSVYSGSATVSEAFSPAGALEKRAPFVWSISIDIFRSAWDGKFCLSWESKLIVTLTESKALQTVEYLALGVIKTE